MALKEVMLIVTIITGSDRPNAQHQEPMPDLKTCLQEAEQFLNHDFPDTAGAVELLASCRGKIVDDAKL